MIHLLPIAQTVIDWEAFLKDANASLGRSPTASLDKGWLRFSRSLSDFICILKEIETPGAEPFSPAGALLSHIHFSFLMVATDSATLSIVTKTRLTFTVVPSKINNFQLSIVSGTAYEWRSALLDCLSPNVNSIPQDLRDFGTDVLKEFEKLKLQSFMSGLIQTPVADGTARLVGTK